jgi:hypothetical protein
VSNEIVHAADTYTTFARIAGAPVPQDRAIDGVDQTDFLLGKTDRSTRDGFPVFVADRLGGRQVADLEGGLLRGAAGLVDPAAQARQPQGLRSRHRSQGGISGDGASQQLVAGPAIAIADELERSLKRYPPIAPGTPDPYTPPRSSP